MKGLLAGAGAGSGIGTYLAGAPGWAVVLVVCVTALVCLLVIWMTHKAIYRLATLTPTGSYRGVFGIQWNGSSEPASADAKKPEAPKPRRWPWRKRPPDSS